MSDTIAFLLVDDMPSYRSLLRAMIQSCPRWVIVGEAGDGPAAIQLAANYHPDVILMDADMPGMSGFEATRRIKRIAQDTHIILFGSYHDQEFHHASAAAGGAYYFEKELIDERMLELLIARLFV